MITHFTETLSSFKNLQNLRRIRLQKRRFQKINRSNNSYVSYVKNKLYHILNAALQAIFTIKVICMTKSDYQKQSSFFFTP